MRNKYKVWCETDSKWESVYDHAIPTVCPTDGGHTITSSKIHIVADGSTIGMADYNDLATAAVKQSITMNIWTTLNNDSAGGYTNEDALADVIEKLYNSTTKSFHFEDLKILDKVKVRVAIEVVTTVIDTDIELRLHFDTGVYTFDLTKPQSINRATGTYPIYEEFDLYIGGQDIADATVNAQIYSTEDITVQILGYYIKIEN